MQWQHFYPIAIGIFYKVKSHISIFEAYATHFLMKGSHCIIIAWHTQADMKLIIAQFIRFLAIAKPGKFQTEVALFIL